MSNTVHVKGISSQTSEKEVQEFFSFCGKISSISVTPESGSTNGSKEAQVTFEKETAAKTALLLDNTQLGAAQVSVTMAESMHPDHAEKVMAGEASTSDNISQEDKPRSRIVAEYLAHGYVISDKAIERAISLDQQHGVSNRFMTTLTNIDSKYGVSQKAGEMDQKYGVSERAQQGWLGLSSYFEKAANTPTGQRVRDFYNSGSKQVLDVHNEAKHLASLKSGKPEEHIMSPSAAAKSAAGPGSVPSAEEANMEKVTIDGQEKTQCNCGGADGKCPCPPGQCACEGCSKKTTTTSAPGTTTTT